MNRLFTIIAAGLLLGSCSLMQGNGVWYPGYGNGGRPEYPGYADGPNRPASPVGHDRPGYGSNNYRQAYYVGKHAVYYDGHEIKGASPNNFKVLRDGYASDPWTVYYCGVPVKNASVNSFKALGYGYAKDAWTVFFNGSKVSNASANSFKVLKNGYAKDAWNTFYWGRRVE
ncbi:MAG: DKNYY domain-containing protein [Duncaniella sp.]|nr:DKNYY domain-containing protein [Duncaniella sp.]MDE6117683.1 DKNYY domain-containing protein [Duncaniella sp.]MDE7144532.1 DKNYY domain-containing protein [Duncaniella sp.]